uniref:ABC transporter substrate-binding protein n=1 Tax=Thermodesulfobium narugense TaxID=184064 RepID=A0A7C5KDT2_9BACT
MQKKLLAAVIVAIVIVGAGYWYYQTYLLPPPPPRTIYVSHWGFGWDQIKKIVIEPFESKYNVKIVLISGTTSERFTKLTTKAEPVPDVIFLPDYYTYQAQQKGLLIKLDLSKISNYEKVYKVLRDQIPKSLAEYGVPFTIQDLALAYRTDRHSKISSWKDMWRDDFKGKVLMPTITATSGPMALVMTSLAYGGSIEDVEPGFKALEALKKDIVTFYSRSSDPQTLFERGEVEIAPVLRYNWAPLKNLSVPVDIIYPVEGSLYVLNMISVVNGSKNIDLAYKLIDFWLSTEIQKNLALAGVDAPINSEVSLPSDHPFNISPVFNNKPLYLNPEVLAKNLKSWVDAWKSRVEG